MVNSLELVDVMWTPSTPQIQLKRNTFLLYPNYFPSCQRNVYDTFLASFSSRSSVLTFEMLGPPAAAASACPPGCRRSCFRLPLRVTRHLSGGSGRFHELCSDLGGSSGPSGCVDFRQGPYVSRLFNGFDTKRKERLGARDSGCRYLDCVVCFSLTVTHTNYTHYSTPHTIFTNGHYNTNKNVRGISV